MKRVALVVLAVGLLGCNTSRPVGAARQGVSEGPAQLTPANVEQIIRTQKAAKAFAPERIQAPPAALEAAPLVEVTRTEERAPEAPPPRDYETELRTLVGSPMTCIPSGTQLARVRIHVSAIVTESGVVSRASATSAESREAATCISARLNSARFRGPVDGAPRTVETTLDLRFRETP